MATDRAEIKRTVVTPRKALTPRADAEAGFQDRFRLGSPEVQSRASVPGDAGREGAVRTPGTSPRRPGARGAGGSGAAAPGVASVRARTHLGRSTAGRVRPGGG